MLRDHVQEGVRRTIDIALWLALFALSIVWMPGALLVLWYRLSRKQLEDLLDR